MRLPGIYMEGVKELKGKRFEVLTKSQAETESLGSRLGERCRPGDLLALEGELGSGKTCFARGVARGLGVRSAVQSPTFTIIREYRGVIPVYHFDVYRLNSAGDLEDLGYEEYFFPGPGGRHAGVVIVEWADKVKTLLPRERMWIRLSFVEVPGPSTTAAGVSEGGHCLRRVTFTPSGERYMKLLDSFVRSLRA